jgi:hypothetical protein
MSDLPDLSDDDPEELESVAPGELELALEKAYRRGFQQALTLLATCYPNGVSARELIRLANEHLRWRRELGPSRIADSAAPRFADARSPLEQECRGE